MLLLSAAGCRRFAFWHDRAVLPVSGMVIDGLAILVPTLPIFFQVAQGYDSIWFGTIMLPELTTAAPNPVM